MSILCIYHGNCADGFTAAWVVRNVFGDKVEFHAGVHQNRPPDVAGRHVLIVDFSYKRHVLAEMAQSAASIVILDHHKSARNDLIGLDQPVAFDRWRDDKYAVIGALHALFDMDRSGAQIAWDYFHPGDPRPDLVNYVGDRDLWRFEKPMSREVNAYIFAHEYGFDNWDNLHALLSGDKGVRHVGNLGNAIEKKHHKDVAELVGVLQRRVNIGGHDVPVANLPYTLTSDAGHRMAQGEPFAACYWDTPEGRVFSLRSSANGLDVSAIAADYGGGGHDNAAGFRMPIGWEGDVSTTAP